MPARIIGIVSAMAVFFGLRSMEPKPNIDDLIVNSFNKSHEKWVAKGWVEDSKRPTENV